MLVLGVVFDVREYDVPVMIPTPPTPNSLDAFTNDVRYECDDILESEECDVMGGGWRKGEGVFEAWRGVCDRRLRFPRAYTSSPCFYSIASLLVGVTCWGLY